MEITITTPVLIELAKVKSGMQLQQMAEELEISKSRFTEWKTAKAEPSAEVIAYLADKADLPILDTLMTLKPRVAKAWAHAKEQAATSIRNLYFSTVKHAAQAYRKGRGRPA